MNRHHLLRSALTITLLVTALATTGCVRDYNEPKFADIAPNETAYVIPLNGDTTAQAQFSSVAFLEQHKVAAKRIQIPRIWVDNGYLHNSGYYQDAVLVIKVDRTPITMSFKQTDDAVDASGKVKRSDTAIWVESRDSIGFSTGFSVTARIEESDTSTFLYRYPAVSLQQEVATEIRARIQQDAASFSAQYGLDALRSEKNDMMDSIRKDVIPFFAQRGITITTIGQFGGMVYEDKAIQDAINQTFIAQQLKVVAAAQLTAQKDINTKSDEAAHQDQLNSITRAEGEAKAIKLVADAAHEAASNPVFVRLRELEIEGARIQRWNGIMPTTVIEGGGGGAGGFNLLISPKAQ